jgi:uncharacterized membrane protein YccC
MEKEMVTFVLISVFGLLGGLVGEFGFDQHCIIGSIIGAVIGLIFSIRIWRSCWRFG